MYDCRYFNVETPENMLLCCKPFNSIPRNAKANREEKPKSDIVRPTSCGGQEDLKGAGELTDSKHKFRQEERERVSQERQRKY